MNLQKSLVYFSTSLRSNDVVLEKLQKNNLIPLYEKDMELLDDVIIENRQAIEMAAFAENDITFLSIPNSVTYMSTDVFAYNNLESVFIPSGLTTLNTAFFDANNLTKVIIPSNIDVIYSPFGDNNMSLITVQGKNKAPDGFSGNWNNNAQVVYLP